MTKQLSHTYTAPGIYTILVTDSANKQAQTTFEAKSFRIDTLSPTSATFTGRPPLHITGKGLDQLANYWAELGGTQISLAPVSSDDTTADLIIGGDFTVAGDYSICGGDVPYDALATCPTKLTVTAT